MTWLVAVRSSSGQGLNPGLTGGVESQPTVDHQESPTGQNNNHDVVLRVEEITQEEGCQ